VRQGIRVSAHFRAPAADENRSLKTLIVHFTGTGLVRSIGWSIASAVQIPAPWSARLLSVEVRKNEHPAKTMPRNSYKQTWIRVTYIFINDMRTISA